MKVCACGCGAEFTPRRSDGRFASTTCRVRWNRAKNRATEDAEFVEAANVVAIAGRRVKSKSAAATGEGPVASSVRRELGDAATTSLGQQALVLARRLDDNTDTGSALASLSKQLVTLTAAALREKAPDAEEDLVGAVQAEVLAMRRRYADASA